MSQDYYRVIDGKRYDDQIIRIAEEAVAGRRDGRISLEDAERLLAAVKDANKYTDIEKSTMRYVRERFRFTPAADRWFRREIRSWAAIRGRAAREAAEAAAQQRTQEIPEPTPAPPPEFEPVKQAPPEEEVTPPAEPPAPEPTPAPPEVFELVDPIPPEEEVTPPAEPPAPEPTPAPPPRPAVPPAAPRPRARGKRTLLLGAAVLGLAVIAFFVWWLSPAPIEPPAPPVTSETAAPQPEVTQPETPAPSEPEVTQPEAPAATEPEITQPAPPAASETAAPQPEVTQPETPEPGMPGGEHNLERGESLWDLAEKFYQDPLLWTNIYRVNRDRISDPDLVRIGMKIVVPPLEGSASQLTDVDQSRTADGYMEAYLAYRRLGRPKAAAYLTEAKRRDSNVEARFKDRMSDSSRTRDGSPSRLLGDASPRGPPGLVNR
ncbi:MAG: LysM peptidoglycan-binding domain-containing protein [SAR324 cluster bacterium]|nr:LysM peptidoglycan-binding domain-containing protein [SAR324 cluster bacterium]